MTGTLSNHAQLGLRRPSRLALATVGAAIGLSLALLPSSALAAAATVNSGSESLDGTFVDTMICGWYGTFVTYGQDHWNVVIADAHHGHVTYQESVVYTMTIHDSPGVPADLAGVTWRGSNEFSFVANWDPSSSREISRSVQVWFEGPFRSLSARITLHVAPDGTIVADRQIIDTEPNCSTLG